MAFAFLLVRIGPDTLPMYHQWKGIGTSKPDQCSTICGGGGCLEEEELVGVSVRQTDWEGN